MPSMRMGKQITCLAQGRNPNLGVCLRNRDKQTSFSVFFFSTLVIHWLENTIHWVEKIHTSQVRKILELIMWALSEIGLLTKFPCWILQQIVHKTDFSCSGGPRTNRLQDALMPYPLLNGEMNERVSLYLNGPPSLAMTLHTGSLCVFWVYRSLRRLHWLSWV